MTTSLLCCSVGVSGVQTSIYLQDEQVAWVVARQDMVSTSEPHFILSKHLMGKAPHNLLKKLSKMNASLDQLH
jgi:hypothetical protein